MMGFVITMRGEKKNIKGEVTKEAKTCFQTKTFVQDLVMAKAMLESDVDDKDRPIDGNNDLP